MALFDRFFKDHPNPDDVRMTLGEHLEELRSRLVRAIVGLIVGAIICYVFIDEIMGFLCWPIFAILDKHGLPRTMSYLNPPEPFITDLKIALIVGFIVSAPYSLMQIWGFIAAGLYPNERKWVRRFAPVSIALFFTGAAFLLTIVTPLLLDFLISYRKELPEFRLLSKWLVQSKPVQVESNDTNTYWPTSQPMPVLNQDPENPPEKMAWLNLRDHEIRIRIGDEIYTSGPMRSIQHRNRLDPNIRITEYVVFVLHLAAAFGIGFQVPVVVAFLAAVGIAKAKDMAYLRRYVWFAMAIISAVITPPDVTSMLFLLLPMALLYEVGLFAARLIERERPTSE